MSDQLKHQSACGKIYLASHADQFGLEMTVPVGRNRISGLDLRYNKHISLAAATNNSPASGARAAG